MLDVQNGRVPARSVLALAVLKAGLAFGAVWIFAVLAWAARIVFEWA